jgi:glyoxylase-like metal-dependent hydrolase (beta-lactamase superfamily II)
VSIAPRFEKGIFLVAGKEYDGPMPQRGIFRWLGRTGRVTVRRVDHGHGITGFRVHSRWTRFMGMPCCFYLVGDLLIDSGFANAREAILAELEGERIRAICLTHNHEDHPGNAGAIADRHDCPVYLHRPDELRGEGVARLKPYRQLFWGDIASVDVRRLPRVVEGDGVRLEAIPTPGHSRTHVAFLEPASRTVFVGDLMVSMGAAAVMTQESPRALAASLRRVAALRPQRLVAGHGLDRRDAVDVLEHKAEAIERAVAEARRLADRGLSARAIERQVFPRRGRIKDLLFKALTQGEFSRRNFVRAVIRDGADGVGSQTVEELAG